MCRLVSLKQEAAVVNLAGIFVDFNVLKIPSSSESKGKGT